MDLPIIFTHQLHLPLNWSTSHLPQKGNCCKRLPKNFGGKTSAPYNIFCNYLFIRNSPCSLCIQMSQLEPFWLLNLAQDIIKECQQLLRYKRNFIFDTIVSFCACAWPWHKTFVSKDPTRATEVWKGECLSLFQLDEAARFIFKQKKLERVVVA